MDFENSWREGCLVGSYGTIDNTRYVPKAASSTLSVRATKSSDPITKRFIYDFVKDGSPRYHNVSLCLIFSM